LRTVLITLVTGLAAINAAGVYGRLVEAHIGVTVASTSSGGERIGAFDARIAEWPALTRGEPDRRGDIQADRERQRTHGPHNGRPAT
jgi:hypothetical protein